METMQPTTGPTGVPWDFAEGIWTWTTRHFRAKIINDGRGFGWAVEGVDVPEDGVAALTREGRAPDFDAARKQVLETVGKAYPRSLGYGDFVGRLARTYRIKGGKHVDLTGLEGRKCVVAVTGKDGAVRRLVGTIRSAGESIEVTAGAGPAVRVDPAHIAEINDPWQAPAETSRIAGRLYHGAVSPSCTGQAGWEPETVTHHGQICPVHESEPRTAT